MQNIKNALIALLIILLLCGVSFLAGRYTKPTDIKVIDKYIYSTIYKDIPTEYTPENFDRLLFCAKSPIDFRDRTEKNYLFVTAFDACKENTARYEIGQNTDWIFYGELVLGGMALGGLTYLIITR